MEIEYALAPYPGRGIVRHVRRTADSRSLTEVAEAIWGALDPKLRVAMVAGRGRDPQPILELP